MTEFSYVWEIPDSWQSPQETINKKAGDCEDFAALASAYLGSIGIPNDLIILEFKDLDISHAVCAWKNEKNRYNFISNQTLVRTGKKDILEAVEEYYPDCEKIVFSDLEKKHSQSIAMR
ncbi:MAG: hypothetical protein HQ594_04375 [Candidatus Omnitrophica bacterium]|nr:hypothetical protein [Candidatus Omnitrophota bacterium]